MLIKTNKSYSKVKAAVADISSVCEAKIGSGNTVFVEPTYVTATLCAKLLIKHDLPCSGGSKADERVCQRYKELRSKQ